MFQMYFAFASWQVPACDGVAVAVGVEVDVGVDGVVGVEVDVGLDGVVGVDVDVGPDGVVGVEVDVGLDGAVGVEVAVEAGVGAGVHRGAFGGLVQKCDWRFALACGAPMFASATPTTTRVRHPRARTHSMRKCFMVSISLCPGGDSDAATPSWIVREPDP